MIASNKDRSEAIVKWLKEHSLMNLNALCAAVDYDRSHLQKVMNGEAYRNIAARHLDAFERELAKYGFLPIS